MRKAQLLFTWIPVEPRVALRLLSRSISDMSGECKHVIGSKQRTRRYTEDRFSIMQGYWHNVCRINQIIEKGIYCPPGTTLNGHGIVWYQGVPRRSTQTCVTYDSPRQCDIFMHRPLDRQWQICEWRPLVTFTAHSKTRCKNLSCNAGLELSVSKGQSEG